MKLQTLYETSIIEESFKDFERVMFPYFFSYYKSINSSTTEQSALLIFHNKLEEFRELRDRNLIQRGDADLSSWMRRIKNDGPNQEELRSFLLLIYNAQEKVPRYHVVANAEGIEIYHIENFAASKKFCSSMRSCIASNESNFDDYTDTGNIFVMVVGGGDKFTIVTNFDTDGYDIWNSDNEEIGLDELIESLPKIRQISVIGRIGDDLYNFIEDFNNSLEIYKDLL